MSGPTTVILRQLGQPRTSHEHSPVHSRWGKVVGGMFVVSQWRTGLGWTGLSVVEKLMRERDCESLILTGRRKLGCLRALDGPHLGHS